MDPANSREALIEAHLDAAEGADMLMVNLEADRERERWRERKTERGGGREDEHLDAAKGVDIIMVSLERGKQSEIERERWNEARETNRKRDSDRDI